MHSYILSQCLVTTTLLHGFNLLFYCRSWVCHLVHSLSLWVVSHTRKDFPRVTCHFRSPLGLLGLRFYSGGSASSLSLTWGCFSFPQGVSAFGAQESTAHLCRLGFIWFIANQNHSFGVSKSTVPTPHNLVPICGMGLLLYSRLDKRPLTKICPSPLLRLSSTFLLPCLCHCVWGIRFMTDPLSCVLGSPT